MKSFPSPLLIAGGLMVPQSLMAHPLGKTSGLNDYWPWIMGLAVLLLTLLWYQQVLALKRKKQHPSGTRGRIPNQMILLGVVTVLILGLLATPWYLNRLQDSYEAAQKELISEDLTEIVFQVEGMTCTGCESLIQRRLGELKGVAGVVANHLEKTTMVKFDPAHVSPDEIARVIEDAGYTVLK